MRIIITILFTQLFLDAFSQSPGIDGSKIFTSPYDNLKYEVLNDDTVLVVDKMPVFPGGTEGLNDWIAKNIKSLKNNNNEDIHGKIIVQWTVQKDGTVSNLKIIKNYRSDIDSIIIAPFDHMPKWQPGYQGKTPVPVVYTLPISF